MAHPLETAYGLSATEILDAVAKRFRLRAALEGAVAEVQMERKIQALLGSLVERYVAHDLDAQPDVPTRLARHPVYLSDAMREEVPWMYQQPPVWRCLSPGLGHAREHLALIELLKHQLRARVSA